MSEQDILDIEQQAEEYAEGILKNISEAEVVERFVNANLYEYDSEVFEAIEDSYREYLKRRFRGEE